MNKPMMYQVSKEGMMDSAIWWMKSRNEDVFKNDPQKYHERLGLLVDFLSYKFPSSYGPQCLDGDKTE